MSTKTNRAFINVAMHEDVSNLRKLSANQAIHSAATYSVLIFNGPLSI